MNIINSRALTCTFRSYSTLKMSNFNLTHVGNFKKFALSDIFPRGHALAANLYQDVTMEYVHLLYLLADFAQICSWINA